MNFRQSVCIQKRTGWDSDWGYTESVHQVGKSCHLCNTEHGVTLHLLSSLISLISFIIFLPNMILVHILLELYFSGGSDVNSIVLLTLSYSFIVCLCFYVCWLVGLAFMLLGVLWAFSTCDLVSDNILEKPQSLLIQIFLFCSFLLLSYSHWILLFF